LIAWAVTAVLGFLAAVHVFWGLGGRLGWLAALPERGGEPAFVPSALASFAVAACLAAAALVAAATAGLLPLPLPVPVLRWACFALAAVFALRAVGDFRLVGFSKRIRGTRFARFDDLLYSPLCVLLATGLFAVARGA